MAKPKPSNDYTHQYFFLSQSYYISNSSSKVMSASQVRLFKLVVSNPDFVLQSEYLLKMQVPN